MSISELLLELKRLDISPERYSLDEGLKPEAYWLQNDSGIWKVYYLDERGGQKFIKLFIDENQACRFFFEKVVEAYLNKKTDKRK